MADSSEPKEETAQITVSPPTPNPQPASTAQSRETVRIHLPRRPTPNPPAPQAQPPSPARTFGATMPAPMTTHAPKKETARITVLSDPPAKAVVEMKKTQRLIDLPPVETPASRVTVAQAPQQPVSRIDEIPMPLCWALLAASAATLILQIWNYVS
jgi:hypothetical protein